VLHCVLVGKRPLFHGKEGNKGFDWLIFLCLCVMQESVFRPLLYAQPMDQIWRAISFPPRDSIATHNTHIQLHTSVGRWLVARRAIMMFCLHQVRDEDSEYNGNGD